MPKTYLCCGTKPMAYCLTVLSSEVHQVELNVNNVSDLKGVFYKIPQQKERDKIVQEYEI